MNAQQQAHALWVVMRSGGLDEELAKWQQIKTDEVPKIAALIKQLDLPALSAGAKSEPAK